MKDEYIKLEEAVTKFVETNSRNFDTTQIVYLLNRLPKYEMPEPRPKGEWHKNVEYSATGNERAMADQCSACSGMVPWGMSDKFDFCPNCGADMRGEDE